MNKNEGNMKVGYLYALKILYDAYRGRKNGNYDENQLKSIEEGIEYLCLPFREDVDSSVTSKMQNPFTDPKKTTNVSEYFESLENEQKNEITKNYFLLNSEANSIMRKLKKGGD